MPDVGVTKDRLVFRHLQQHASSEQVHSLICFICAQIYTDISGSVAQRSPCSQYSDKLQSSFWYGKAEPTTEIKCRDAQVMIDAADLISESLSVEKYKKRYGTKDGVHMHLPE